MREFSASRHFFKTNVTQSVAEFILYSQKTRNCGHFLSNFDRTFFVGIEKLRKSSEPCLSWV